MRMSRLLRLANLSRISAANSLQTPVAPAREAEADVAASSLWRIRRENHLAMAAAYARRGIATENIAAAAFYGEHP